MHVQMVDRLTCLGTGVDHQPISLREAFFQGDSTRNQEELAQDIRMAVLNPPNALNVLVGHYQHVRGCLRIAIVESGQVVVPVHDAR
jgi:hypothetical protein